MSEMCRLKRFGVLDMNIIVPYRKHPNPELVEVYFSSVKCEKAEWHTVPVSDVEFMNDKETGQIAIVGCGNRTKKTLSEVIKNRMSVEIHDDMEKLKSSDFDECLHIIK